MAAAGFQVGELIENRYRVLSVIGAGGMGTLYRVSDEARDGEIVALKTVKVNLPDAQTPENIERFQREFRLLTQLRHPNLVSVYDFGVTTKGDLYFTMEWVQGEALDPPSFRSRPAAVIPIIVPICRALAYLHARGVIHGDLKPANVLMVEDQIKIVDFGVALETRSPQARAEHYTPGYTAPEVKEHRPVDHRIDLYSLGAIGYYLVTKEPPLFMPGADRAIRLALDEALQAQDEIPIEIGAVIARLLATSPADRYAGANEVIVALNEAAGSAYALETRETASSYALRGRFVGREAEMEMLRRLWEQAQSGEGKLILISGETGVGKTRLVEEFVAQAEMQGARVARGQCVEGGGVAYRPWREALRVLIRYVESANEPTVRRAGPVLATLLPELWQRRYMAGAMPPADLDPQAAQQRLNDAIVQILRATAELRPTVIVIEDAHWADEATLTLLSFLTRISEQAGLLVCVTYRTEVGPEHPLAMLEGDRVQRLPLRNLPLRDTVDLVRSMLGLDQLPALLMERVQQATGGNVFFAQELIRSLAEDSAVLERTVDGWRVNHAALVEAHLPESVRHVVWRHLDRLSAETQQALRWASIVGPIFWEGAVEKVGRAAWKQVHAALREGEEHELILKRDTSSIEGQWEYLFFKPAVREACYESVPPQERRTCHGRVAAWLIAHCDEQAGEHLGLITDHLERAGQTEQAVGYLRRAGEQAAAQFANAEAIAYFSRALNLIPGESLIERYDLLLAREKLYNLQGEREAQTQDLMVLKELAEMMKDDRRRAEVALCQARYAEATGDYAAAIAAAQRAIELARHIQDASSEAAGHMQWGFALRRQGEYQAARLELEQAITLAQAAGAGQVETDSLSRLAFLCTQQGDYAGARLRAQQAQRRSREMSDRQGESYAGNVLGNAFSEQGDYAQGQAYFEQSLQICREIGDRWGEAMRLVNLGWVSLDQGHYAQATQYLEQVLQTCREIGDLSNEGEALNLLGSVWMAQGHYDQGRDCFEQSLRIFRKIGNQEGECWALSRLGLLSCNVGDPQAAQEYSQRALSIGRKIQSAYQSHALTNLGHALLGLNRPGEAADCYRQAWSLQRGWGQHKLAIESSAGLARVALAQADLTQARVYVDEILSYLNDHTLQGAKEPFRVYWTCYCVLQACQDGRAQDILAAAYHLLQEQAAQITDEELRRSFLENVPAHREIVSEWANRQAGE